MKKIISLCLLIFLTIIFVSCSKNASNSKSSIDNETILLAAAASLRSCMEDELIPLFEENNSNVSVIATYDGSGKLQTQIEEGADVDVFMSASLKNMNALNERGLIVKNSVINLLENKVVLIVSSSNPKGINNFEDISKADSIALGDPESVPAGLYGKELLESYDLWTYVEEKISYASNVIEVLNWVKEGSADAGLVYSTDAALSKDVEVVFEAPQEKISKVIYPVGIVNTTSKIQSSKLFVEFLKSKEALTIFEKYGFEANKEEL